MLQIFIGSWKIFTHNYDRIEMKKLRFNKLRRFFFLLLFVHLITDKS